MSRPFGCWFLSFDVQFYRKAATVEPESLSMQTMGVSCKEMWHQNETALNQNTPVDLVKFPASEDGEVSEFARQDEIKKWTLA